MADRAQKVAVRRAGEEVEIIPATLKGQASIRGSLGPESGHPSHTPRGRAQQALGKGGGPCEGLKWRGG